MSISISRETAFKLIIVLFSALIFFLTASILIYTETIRFEWSNQILAKWNYDQSKTKANRILVLGDSQLTWWNLDHCLYEDIRHFSNDHDIGYVNASMGGFGPIEYLDRMKAISPGYKPNLVILFYYSGNDLTDVLYRRDQKPKRPDFPWWKQLTFTDDTFTEARKKNPFSKEPIVLQPKEKKEILQNYNFDWPAFKQAGIDSNIIAYAQNRLYHPGKIGREYVNPHILVMGSWKPNYLFDNLTIQSSESKIAWKSIEQKLDEILQLVHSIDAELKLVCIPSTVQVDESHHDFYRKITFNVEKKLTNAHTPQDNLAKWAAKSGIQYIDLLPTFKAHKNTADLYFENDDHLSEKGHIEAFKPVREEILLPFVQSIDKN
ncbi:SGNH/GDSL hydrolase family protein [Lewinella cohaerens]|uniref:SGNH/GDSL hydrolase family protein n=1 Tax=Lewinella cohaerens TaxID=70995 RepID=UPI0003820A49|nr:SGNH/GDSL hydrolase family protein [Lewinella cohaerens]